MSVPLLSICIPTWQRAGHIQAILDFFCDFEVGIPLEIIVSDNASEDDTEKVTRSFASRLPVRYLRQRQNIGAEGNLISAFRHARGEFSIYVGDDDRLLKEGLQSAVQRLLENPRRAAVYAPWEDWDEGTETSMGMHFTWKPEEEGDQPNAVVLLARFVASGGFPEIGVYRSAFLRRALYLPHQSYWAQSWASRLAGLGPVYVQCRPFYRSLARTKAKRDRMRLGVEQTMMFQDRYRAGIEVAFWESIRQTGISHLPAANAAEFAVVVDTLASGRLRAGAYLSGRVNDWVRAVEFGKRSRLYGSRAEKPDEVAGARQATADREQLLQELGVVPPPSGEHFRFSLCLLHNGDDAALHQSLATVDLANTECLVVSATEVPPLDPRVRTIVSPLLQNDGRKRLVGLWFATGDYVAALPTSAVLISEALEESLDALDGLPDCRAWMTTETAEDTDVVAFEWTDVMDHFIRVTSADFHPNFCIFRRAGLEEVLFPAQTILPAWSWWIQLSKQAQVCLSPIPWAKGGTTPPEDPGTLRGALELFLAEILGEESLNRFDAAQQQQLRRLLNRRILISLEETAIRLSKEGDPLGALELLARRQLWLNEPHPLDHTSPLIDRAAASLLAEAAARTSGCSGLTVCGMVFPHLEGVRFSDEASILESPPTSLVLVPDPAMAERLRVRLDPGLVIVWPELRQMVQRLV